MILSSTDHDGFAHVQCVRNMTDVQRFYIQWNNNTMKNELTMGCDARHSFSSMSNPGIIFYKHLYILLHALRSHVYYDTSLRSHI